MRCPYCEARIIVDPPGNAPVLVEPSVSREYVRRLFPSSMVSSLALKYFPYLETDISSDRKVQRCFNQPWQDLEEYIPPSGNMRVFDESLADPDQLIPFDRDMAEESRGRVIFHPFYVVMLNLEGYSEGLLADAVSGKLIGEMPVTEERRVSAQNLHRIFLVTLTAGLAFTIPVYFITKDLDLSWLSRIWSFIIIIPLAVAFYHFRIKAGRK